MRLKSDRLELNLSVDKACINFDTILSQVTHIAEHTTAWSSRSLHTFSFHREIMDTALKQMKAGDIGKSEHQDNMSV